jgi:hypothetical protein
MHKNVENEKTFQKIASQMKYNGLPVGFTLGERRPFERFIKV